MSYLDPQSWTDVDAAGNALDWASRDQKLWYPAYEMIRRAHRERGYLCRPRSFSVLSGGLWPYWEATTTYAQGAQVDYRLPTEDEYDESIIRREETYISLIDGNTGNHPNDVDSDGWSEFWQPVYYPRASGRIYTTAWMAEAHGARGQTVVGIAVISSGFAGYIPPHVYQRAGISSAVVSASRGIGACFMNPVLYEAGIHGTPIATILPTCYDPFTINDQLFTTDEMLAAIAVESDEAWVSGTRPQAAFSDQQYRLCNALKYTRLNYHTASNAGMASVVRYARDTGLGTIETWPTSWASAVATWNATTWQESQPLGILRNFDITHYGQVRPSGGTTYYRIRREKCAITCIAPFPSLPCKVEIYVKFDLSNAGLSDARIYDNADHAGSTDSYQDALWYQVFADTDIREPALEHTFADIGGFESVTVAEPTTGGGVVERGWRARALLIVFNYNVTGAFKFLYPVPIE